MKTRIKWVENACMIGETESNHAVVMDGATKIGGRNVGMRPMEMLLVGLGGCTMLDVLSLLKNDQQNVTDCVIEVTSKRRDKHPKTFSEIHIRYILTGHNLDESKVKQAIDLSARIYCSAAAMLEKTATVVRDYEVREVADFV